jgi:hypothetical protein
MASTLQRRRRVIQAVSIVVAIMGASATGPAVIAQIKPDSISHVLDLKDAAAIMVRADKVMHESRSLQRLVKEGASERAISFALVRLASVSEESKYYPKYLPPPQGFDSVIAQVVVVFDVSSIPPSTNIVAFDHQRRPYRLQAFDTSDFGLLVSRVFPSPGLNPREAAPEILRLFLALEMYDSESDMLLITDPSCLPVVDSVPVLPPQYRFEKDTIEIGFFVTYCRDDYGYWLSRHRLRYYRDGRFEYQRLDVWPRGECWCKDK